MREMIGLYLKEKRYLLFFQVLFVVVFAGCFYLTDVKLEYVWYPALLCFVLGSGALMWDFYRFYKKHTHLQELKNSIDMTIDNLKKPKNQLEEDYQELLFEIRLKECERRQELQHRLDGYKEYITLWAHQIKTPITAMALVLQEMNEENVYERTRELNAHLIETEQYVDTTLQFMRLDSMTSDLVLQEQSLFDMVRQAVRYFAKVFRAKHLSMNLQAEDVTVVTDEKWMVFVLKQIISNALKYTRTGSISIYMHPQQPRTLVIEDTGIGIAAEDIPRLFERGYTGYNGRMQKKATGIGLYLSKEILDKLGHTIVIKSQENVGTKVEIGFLQPNFTKSSKILKKS